MHKETLISSALLLMAILLLAACGRAPSPSPEISPLGSSLSPIETPVVEESVRFDIDEPLLPDATRVSGVGPAGMEITIVDVTLVNREIGKGKVKSNNTFDIEVSPPLSGGHRIGIVPVIDLTPEEAEQYAGDGSRFFGKGGWILESAVVVNQ